VAGIYTCVGNFIFLALNLLGGFAILVINEIPLTIGAWQAVAGTACIVIAGLWEIPLCLWLSKKGWYFLSRLFLMLDLASVLGIFTATSSLWIICPYSWVPHLMISVLGILPNGESSCRSECCNGVLDDYTCACHFAGLVCGDVIF